MKRASWVLRATSVAIGCVAFAHGLVANAAPLSAVHLVDAQLAVAKPGNLVDLPAKKLALPSDLEWVAVRLPHALPRSVTPTMEGTDPLKMHSLTAWYRLRISAWQMGGTLTGLYLPRWHTFGNLAIYGNGELLYSSLEEGISSAFNDPLLVRMPVAMSQERELELTVRMDSVSAVGGALSSIWVGPMTELRPMFETRRNLQNRVPQITSVIFLVLGVFALGFWARRRHEVSQLIFFVLSVLFYIRNLHYYVNDVPIPEDWFPWLTVNSLGWLNIGAYLFALHLHGQRYVKLERILIGAIVLASLMSLPLGFLATTVGMLSSVTYLIFTAVWIAVTLLITFAAWRARSLECGVLAGIFWLNLGLGIHDWMLQHWLIDIESIYLLPFGVVALFGMFLTTELRRYLGAVSASEKASAVLEARLNDRERELRLSYGKLREIEQAQLLSQERQRLMREMHDGLGSALMSSLVAVERGQMQPGDIAQVLRECVDDLKLTIDSLEPVGDDLLVLLASLRYRLEPRLEAAGIKLLWEIQPIPKLEWLNPSASLHILRMLQEILTNTLKHARATTIRVATEQRHEEILIAVTDNGAGFNVAASRESGRGLANLTRRALEVGGRVTIESAAGGTTATICLPVTRAVASAPD